MAASIAMIVLWVLPPRESPTQTSIFAETAPETVFLFDGETLIDSTASARALLAASPMKGAAWGRLMAFLAARFENLEAQLLRVPIEGAIELAPADRSKPLILKAEHAGGLTRLTLLDVTKDIPASGGDVITQRAISDELSLLRDTIAAAPMLLWRENAAGDVIWANGPYLLQAYATLDESKEMGWPLPRLFSRAAAKSGKDQRQSLSISGKPTIWFDISSQPETNSDLMFAIPADSAVQAESALRDFMQTLTKTFAQLPIGLAIFDRQRKLQLFNPALMDLTQLPADFLSLRPSLLAVLDAMRDRKMLPEPKDYRDWRRQIIEIEKAAATGLYEETWSLPDGQTYKVIGRPHPNGALALLIEDISSEMLRTRRYRADLELGQSVIDHMDDAIAVFSQSGQLVMSNSSYATLWGHDPAETLADNTVRTLSAHWRAQSAPSAIWAEVEEYVATVGDRDSWRGEARLLDGRLVGCRFAPLAGGSTLATFRSVPPLESGQTRLADSVGLRRA
ncbi:MAG: PAS-domain containing protein [Cypionkella sp.]|uniref:PAS-domain containing protein n=1 Tax=Cypionkella sp. TaxID=2811411 RepID=UPI002ABA60CE|nr:PAS-domain containing protein [Cypionkella sp.]MDZ4312247.1 PAS-domain containing protein [Cypionkella sp.]